MAVLWWTAEWSLPSLSLLMSTVLYTWSWKTFAPLPTKPWTWLLINTLLMWNQVMNDTEYCNGFLVEFSDYSCVFPSTLSQDKFNTCRKKSTWQSFHILIIIKWSLQRTLIFLRGCPHTLSLLVHLPFPSLPTLSSSLFYLSTGSVLVYVAQPSRFGLFFPSVLFS